MISDRRRFAADRPATGRGQVGDRSGTVPRQAEDALVASVAAAARAGIDLVQVRERDLDGGALVRLVARCLDASRHTRTRVLVNDRVDVAMAAGAHGVHLRGDSMPAPRVRAVVPPGFLIGRSIHSREEAARVSAEGGLDYLMFGTVFSTTSKPDVMPAGVQSLIDVASASPLPVLAIGGITCETVRALERTGAAGIAAIGVFADTPLEQLPRTISELVHAFQDQH
jgi:thiamine-phosphate diphosphorylase